MTNTVYWPQMAEVHIKGMFLESILHTQKSVLNSLHSDIWFSFINSSQPFLVQVTKWSFIAETSIYPGSLLASLEQSLSYLQSSVLPTR